MLSADGRLLRTLAEALDAKTVVEFGTSNGVSAIWFSLALRKTGGKLITHELDPETAALARKNFVQAGIAEIVRAPWASAPPTAVVSRNASAQRTSSVRLRQRSCMRPPENGASVAGEAGRSMPARRRYSFTAPVIPET